MLTSIFISVIATILQILPGLQNQPLKYFLIAIGVIVFLWGFERYRTNFSKMEFGLAFLLSIGILVIGLFPEFIQFLSDILQIGDRLVVIILSYVGLIFIVLYLGSIIRSNQLKIADLSRNLSLGQASDFDVPKDDFILVVIPAYNESDTITDVVTSIPDTVRDISVIPLVISDGSTDQTAIRAREAGARVVEHMINQGQGGALKTGFEIAQKRRAKIVVTIDADGQHPLDKIEDLVTPILEDSADYVIGSRYMGVDESNNPLYRRLGIRFFTSLINAITKSDISDCTNGFRAIRGTQLGELTFTEERFNAPELIIEARKNGLRIQEIPISIHERQSGESKKPKVGYALGLARTIFTTWIR